MPFSNLPKTKLKIVVDTNLFISVFVFRGIMVRLIFELVLDNSLEMYASPVLKEELKKKLVYFGVSQQVQDEVMLFVETKSILIDPDISVKKSRDTKDNFLLELSEVAKADYLVTRDNDLLVLKKWKDTTIIMPEDLLPKLRNVGLLE